ncbi:MAG: hypothetical protein CL912_14725 [Deltaproteobacteria bacterium]|nr:hypothetical protein [Deltaproteobacteria bacterium]
MCAQINKVSQLENREGRVELSPLTPAYTIFATDDNYRSQKHLRDLLEPPTIRLKIYRAIELALERLRLRFTLQIPHLPTPPGQNDNDNYHSQTQLRDLSEPPAI